MYVGLKGNFQTYVLVTVSLANKYNIIALAICRGRNMKIYIFGIGNNFIRSYRWLAKHFEICGLIDSSGSVQGKCICSHIVQDASVLLENQYDAIMITVNQHEDILKSLVDLGVPEEKIILLSNLLVESGSFKESKYSVNQFIVESNDSNIHQSVRMGVIMGGGAGNKFVQMNFIYCLHQYLGDESVNLVIFGDQSDELNRLLMEQENGILEYHLPSETRYFYDCDVMIQLEFYPHVLLPYGSWIEKQTPKLYRLLNLWWMYMENEERMRGILLPQLNHAVYQYSIREEKGVLVSYDIEGSLNIEKNYSWRLKPAEYGNELDVFGLQPQEYITVQRGASPLSMIRGSTKLWSKDNYEKLITLLKKRYPEKKIVQLGKTINGGELDGVEVNLLDKTTWTTLGIVLKHAFLHIDGECGMVHYRAALHAGTSVVLFGATPMDFYGYPDNINIKANACPQYCARLTDTWQEQCVRGFDEPPCMEAITPQMVMERIEKAMEQKADPQ